MTVTDMNQPEHSLTILVVDDDKEALEELQDILELEGWNAIIADSVDMALEVLEWYPHIGMVVTDVHFIDPSGDSSNGFQLMARASARFPERDMSFVVLSGDPDAVKPALQSDAVEFLPKPLDPEKLVEAVRAGAQVAGTNSHVPTAAETGEDLLRKVQRITRDVHTANVLSSQGAA